MKSNNRKALKNLVKVILLAIAVIVVYAAGAYDTRNRVQPELDALRGEVASLEAELVEAEETYKFQFYRGIFATCYQSTRNVKMCATFAESAAKAKAFDTDYPVFNYLPEGSEVY